MFRRHPRVWIIALAVAVMAAGTAFGILSASVSPRRATTVTTTAPVAP